MTVNKKGLEGNWEKHELIEKKWVFQNNNFRKMLTFTPKTKTNTPWKYYFEKCVFNVLHIKFKPLIWKKYQTKKVYHKS
jgi:hypothetical protein